MTNLKVLFVCSRNKWRSRTAEEIFKNRSGLEVRSVGTSSSARIKVNEKHILWADVIFVMEKSHKQRISQLFYEASRDKEIVNLNIPDDYQFMDEELIGMLEASVLEYLEF